MYQIDLVSEIELFAANPASHLAHASPVLTFSSKHRRGLRYEGYVALAHLSSFMVGFSKECPQFSGSLAVVHYPRTSIMPL